VKPTSRFGRCSAMAAERVNENQAVDLMGTRSRRLGSWKPTAYKSHRPRPIRRLVHVLASAALLSAVLAVVGATSASAGGTWSSPKTIDDGTSSTGVVPERHLLHRRRP
jgi:hypothetical protein